MSSPLERLTQSLAGRYRLDREVGQGGMATVYLAHDLRHDRDVALKVLHPELGAVIGAERFLAEIKVTARLQHPHILGLIDSGEADGLLFYVMPFVSGESLRVRLQREKQLPIPEVIRIATEVANALNYAHRQGVVHRDIKPENILLHDGQALVADFGIALALTSAGGGRMTQTGMSLGTPHYMSPEQAMGEREITARSDVYALGAMTYEMVTGDPPFTGSTNQAIMAKVMTERPLKPSVTRDTVPPHLDIAILTALAKLPADRWGSTREFAEALANPSLTASHTGAYDAVSQGRMDAKSAASGASLRVGAVAALVALLLGAAAGWFLNRPRPAATFPVEFVVEPDSSHSLETDVSSALALSPDGSRLVYVGRTPGARQLYLRDLGREGARPIAGTEGASDPFFSPDGQWIVFEAGRALKKASLAGGAAVTTIVPNAGDIWGGSWGGDGTIIYSSGTRSGLFRVGQDGGTPEQLTHPDSSKGEGHGYPIHLPGGTIMFSSLSRGADGVVSRLGVVTPGSQETFLDVAGFNPRYLASGEVMYGVSDGSVVAQHFDEGARAFQGAPRRVADGVSLTLNLLPIFTASPNGVVVFRPGAQDGTSASLALPGRPDKWLFQAPGLWSPRFSPDGSRIAYARTPQDRSPGGRDIWIYSIKDGTSARLTAGLQGAVDPSWSPDGNRILFSATRGNNVDLMTVSAGGGEPPTVLLERPGLQYQASYTPDGNRVVFVDAQRGVSDLMSLSLSPGAKVDTIVASQFDEIAPSVSPDGKWIAYQSNETGQVEVYVRALTGAGSRYLVSAGGGREPAWGRGGRELYYRSGSRLQVARLAPGAAFAVQERVPLMEMPTLAGRGNRNYDAAPDGSGFLVLKTATPPRLLVQLRAMGNPQP